MRKTGSKSGLSKGIRYFYGVGDMCYTLMTYVYSYYQIYYLTNVAQLRLGVVSFIMTICSTVDVATAMVASGIMNSTKPMRWGRYRSWLIAITWIIPFFYFFMYFWVGGNEIVSTVIIMFAMIAGRFLHDFPYCANASLIGIVAKSPDDRLTMSSTRATWNNAAKFVWPLFCTPLLSLLTVTAGEKYAYALLAFILAWLMFGAFFVHFKLTEGYEETGTEEMADQAKAERARTGIIDLFRSIVSNPPLLVLVIADFAKWLFNFMVASTVVYYFTYIALNQGLQSTYTLIIAFMSVFGALISRYLGSKLSGRVTLIVSYVCMGVCLLIGRLFYQNVWFVILMLSVAQFFYGCAYSCSTALYADTAVYYEWKSGKNATGWIMGLSIVPLNIASMLKGIVVTATLALGGFSASIAASDASLTMKKGIANTLLVIPAAMLFLGALVLIFFYRLTRERVEAMEAEIRSREAPADGAQPV